MQPSHETLLILDFGSQYTRLIARRVRELQVFSLLKPGGRISLSEIEAISPKAIILSGGPSSVHEKNAPQLPQGFWEAQEQAGRPVLGICYGLQRMVQDLGGRVEASKHREYGRSKLVACSDSPSIVFSGRSENDRVWMSHGDSVVELPPDFHEVARSQSGALAAIKSSNGLFLGLQFHPEVTHTEKGTEILKAFCFDVAKYSGDWTAAHFLEEAKAQIEASVPKEAHVICALSGGVDSTVAARLVHSVIGDRLHCVFVDHGLLRKQEREEVMRLFEEELHLPVTCLDEEERFLSALQGVSDPEEKRKRIGEGFIRAFESFAEKQEQSLGVRPRFLVQGTLYPDVIESSPPPFLVKNSGEVISYAHTIKSHHNVGGLPSRVDFELIEPFRNLFKDEVRSLGALLGVPRSFLARHPFPGPGLAVRILGEVTREDADLLREVDAIFIEEIRKAGLYDEIWQAFAVLLPVRSVGVQGDGRSHNPVVALRAVTSIDGMTADWFPFSSDFLQYVSARISNEVKGIGRVVLDISSKPPATIEWE